MYFLLLVIFAPTIHGIAILNKVQSQDMKIVGGDVVRIEDYPFQVVLIQDDMLWCGGTVISEDNVLTAAHCINYATSPLYVRVGSSFWKTGGSLYRVIANATYGSESNQDISVLKVEKPFTFNATCQPMPLFHNGDVIFPGTVGTVLGWGMQAEAFISEQLRAVDIPYVDQETCRELYEGTEIGEITNGQICAGYLDGTSKDACQGDSGGPLIIDGRQAGIISMGRGCAQPNSPGVYTDVGFYEEWIMEQLRDL